MNTERLDYVKKLVSEFIENNDKFSSTSGFNQWNTATAFFEMMGDTLFLNYVVEYGVDYEEGENEDVSLKIYDDYGNENEVTFDDDSFERGDMYMNGIIIEQTTEVITDTVSDYVYCNF